MAKLKLRDGAELYYETHGSGPPLMLVAGLGGDGRFWESQLPELSQKFTVIVHDHRGTARSTLSRIDYSVAQMADDAWHGRWTQPGSEVGDLLMWAAASPALDNMFLVALMAAAALLILLMVRT